MEGEPEGYLCKICGERASDKTELMEHLREDHETLETLSYAATTMIEETERDRDAVRSYERFERIREEMGEKKKRKRRCPKCGYRVREGAKFCDECGTQL